MKPSNLSTPRSLAECNFTVGYSAAPQPMPRGERIALYASAAGAVALVIFVLVGWVK